MKYILIKKIYALIVSFIFVFFLSEILLFSSINPIKLAMKLDIKSFFIQDIVTGKIIAEKDSDKILPAASTTKLVAAMVAEKVLMDQDVIRIPKEAIRAMPGRAYLQKDEEFYYQDLLKAMLIMSANDAALAIAIRISETEEKFVKKMNYWCRSNGILNTTFNDVTGLSPKSLTTSVDLSRIYSEFRKNKRFIDILKCKSTFIISLKNRNLFLKNSNYIYRYIKTNCGYVIGQCGATKEAGFCFAGEVFFEGNRYILTILSANKDPFWQEGARLINYINDVYSIGNN